MRWILKIILFPISLVLNILTAFLTFLLAIGTTILYLLIFMCSCWSCIIIPKEFFNGNRSIDIGVLVEPIRNTYGWSSGYSFFIRDQ